MKACINICALTGLMLFGILSIAAVSAQELSDDGGSSVESSPGQVAEEQKPPGQEMPPAPGIADESGPPQPLFPPYTEPVEAPCADPVQARELEDPAPAPTYPPVNDEYILCIDSCAGDPVCEAWCDIVYPLGGGGPSGEQSTPPA